MVINLKITFKTSEFNPYGTWHAHPVQFQYDMSLDAQIYTKRQAKKEFLKLALEYYNTSDKAKIDYLKWLMKISQ